MEELYRAGAYVDAVDEKQRTSLYIAAATGNTDAETARAAVHDERVVGLAGAAEAPAPEIRKVTRSSPAIMNEKLEVSGATKTALMRPT